MKAFPVHFVVGAVLVAVESLAPNIIAQTESAVVVAANQPDEAASQPVPPALRLKVIEGVEVKFPDRSVFYQRVAPPAAAARRAPAPAPVAAPLSPAEQEAAEARAKKKTDVLLLSATVFDRQLTQLRWFAGGREYRAWSNIDFNYIAGMGEIETADTVYLLMMGLGNETRESVAEWNRFAPEWERIAREQNLADGWETKLVPALAQFPVGRSTYCLSAEAPADESLAALDALHRYFDAHHLQLIADYDRRTAANLARAEWLKANPPVPQNTVIRFWPKRSRTYPTTAQ